MTAQFRSNLGKFLTSHHASLQNKKQVLETLKHDRYVYQSNKRAGSYYLKIKNTVNKGQIVILVHT